MKKYMIVIVGLGCIGSSLMAKLGEGKPGYPQFEDNYIKVHSNYMLCGGFSIVPKGNQNVRVIAYKYAKGLFGDTFEMQKVLSENPKKAKGVDKGYVEIGSGFRVKYNWPGLRKRFQIYCQVTDSRGNWVPKPCSEVVSIENVRHRRACPKVLQWFGKGAGSHAHYKPLNLK